MVTLCNDIKLFFLEYDDGDTKSYRNERFGMRGKIVADRLQSV